MAGTVDILKRGLLTIRRLYCTEKEIVGNCSWWWNLITRGEGEESRSILPATMSFFDALIVAVDQFFLRVEFSFRPLTFLKNTFRHLPRILLPPRCQTLFVVIFSGWYVKMFPFASKVLTIYKYSLRIEAVYRNCDRTRSTWFQTFTVTCSFRATTLSNSPWFHSALFIRSLPRSSIAWRFHFTRNFIYSFLIRIENIWTKKWIFDTHSIILYIYIYVYYFIWNNYLGQFVNAGLFNNSLLPRCSSEI